jgi:hypothetical protein
VRAWQDLEKLIRWIGKRLPCVRYSTPVETWTISLNTLTSVGKDIIKLVGEDIQAKASVFRRVHVAKAAPTKHKSEIWDHGRQSWIPMDLAEGGS